MKISFKIFIAFSFILLMFSITTYVNFLQANEVKENSKWLSNSQLIIRTSARLQRNIVDMESDLRGYLLTKDNFFLTSYDSLNEENKILYRDLKEMTSSNFQKKKLDSILFFHQKWKSLIADPLMNRVTGSSGSPSSDFRTLYKNDYEKKLRGFILAGFKEFNNYEYELRDVRKKKLDNSVASTYELSIILTAASILIGLVVAVYLVRIISKRIFKMVNLAEEISKGNFDIYIQDESKDELSNLSSSLNKMAKTLSKNIYELEKKNAELNAKNNELNQFAYVVSHDLKAPLKGMENITNWIEEDMGETLDKKLSEYMKMFKGRIKRMENLIEGILDLSRVGKEKRVIEYVDSGQLIQEIMEMLSPDPKFQVKMPTRLPEFFTEKLPLQQVFSNLISNAIKYNDKEAGLIEISFFEEEEHYVFSVSDNGPGIASRYHEKIFMVFQTLKERDAFESTGVGLSIVKKILDEKKCKIEVRSEEGRGTTFSFTWPKEVELVID